MNTFNKPHKQHRALPLALFLAILGLLVLVFPSLAQIGEGGKGTCQDSKLCGPDLVVDYYYDDQCNLHIVITNIGMAPVTIGGSGNPNVVGLIHADGTMGWLGMGNNPVILGSGQSHEIFISANYAATLIGLVVDPDNNLNESNENNNSTGVTPCQPDLVIEGTMGSDCLLAITITNIGWQSTQIGGGNTWRVENIILNNPSSPPPNALNIAELPVTLGAGESLTSGLNFPVKAFGDMITLEVFAVNGESNTANNTFTFTVPPECQCCLGDADQDGDADWQDLSLIRQHILGIAPLPPEVWPFMDINQDGNITTFDIVLIRKQDCFCDKGDVDFDGDVDEDDIQAIQNHILGITPLSQEALERADVVTTTAGAVTVADIAQIRKYILGLISTLC